EPGLEFPVHFILRDNPFGFGAHVAVVEVDRDTGALNVLRYVAVHDCGRVINPKLLEGQVYGAIAQGLVVLGRSLHTANGMLSWGPRMAKFLQRDALMTTAVAPLLSVSPRVQLTARQRACWEQMARRQTSPQRLVRRAKILLALETGATQCHVMRQMHLNRGT